MGLVEVALPICEVVEAGGGLSSEVLSELGQGEHARGICWTQCRKASWAWETWVQGTLIQWWWEQEAGLSALLFSQLLLAIQLLLFLMQRF